MAILYCGSTTNATDTRYGATVHRCRYSGQVTITFSSDSGTTDTTATCGGYSGSNYGWATGTTNVGPLRPFRETRKERAKRLAEQRCYDIRPPRKIEPLRRSLVHGYHNPSIIPLARSNC